MKYHSHLNCFTYQNISLITIFPYRLFFFLLQYSPGYYEGSLCESDPDGDSEDEYESIIVRNEYEYKPYVKDTHEETVI